MTGMGQTAEKYTYKRMPGLQTGHPRTLPAAGGNPYLAPRANNTAGTVFSSSLTSSHRDQWSI